MQEERRDPFFATGQAIMGLGGAEYRLPYKLDAEVAPAILTVPGMPPGKASDCTRWIA
jgi:hypothetical protein